MQTQSAGRQWAPNAPSATPIRLIELSPQTWSIIFERASLALANRRFLVDRDAIPMAERVAEIIAASIPTPELRKIRQFRSDSTSVLHIKGPSGLALTLPPTPTQGFGNDVEIQLFDALLLAVMYIAGFVPVAYDFENHWRLVRNVIPNPQAKGKLSSHGYDEPLGFHTDNPCGEFERLQAPWTLSTLIPRVLGFICLRNSDRNGNAVSTDVLSLETMRRHCSAEAFAYLQKPEFQVNPPASNACVALREVPLIEPVDGSLFLRFNANPEQVLGLTDGARWALAEFKTGLTRAESESMQFHLAPLSILLFDNYTVGHARRSFDPGDDLDRARWLRRCYGLSSTCSGHHIDRSSWPHVIR